MHFEDLHEVMSVWAPEDLCTDNFKTTGNLYDLSPEYSPISAGPTLSEQIEALVREYVEEYLTKAENETEPDVIERYHLKYKY